MTVLLQGCGTCGVEPVTAGQQLGSTCHAPCRSSRVAVLVRGDGFIVQCQQFDPRVIVQKQRIARALLRLRMSSSNAWLLTAARMEKVG